MGSVSTVLDPTLRNRQSELGKTGCFHCLFRTLQGPQGSMSSRMDVTPMSSSPVSLHPKLLARLGNACICLQCLRFKDLTWVYSYYLHPPESLHRDVLLLLPLSQVQALINEIATAFKVEVTVPGFPFSLSFFDDGTPQPKLLGTTRSRADINDMQDKIPAPVKGHGEPPENASPALDYSFAAFKRKMDKAAAANKKKAAAVKKKKAQDRFLVIQDWCKQLRRAQRYFGLRPRPGKVPEPDPNMSWAEQEAFIKKHEKHVGLILDPLDVTKEVPFPFEEEPIIISVDIESYERAHSLITEIGISTLDTLDLVGTVPGDGGANWMKSIRSRHFRIKGREHLINKDFVTGHPDEFQFGESEFVALEDAGKAIGSCFEWPFSVQYKHDGRLKNVANNWATHTAEGQPIEDTAASTTNGGSSANGTSSDPSTMQQGPPQRTILLLGHDLGTDLNYLANLGSRIFSAPRPPTYPAPHIDPDDIDNPVHSILEALDTATLYKVLTREAQTRSLTSIMGDLGRTAWYAHCGGNDARYTLEALVAMVIKARIQDDQEKAARQAAVGSGLENSGWAQDPAAENGDTAGNTHDGTGTAESTGSANEPSHAENDTTDGTDKATTNNPLTTTPQSLWEAEKSRRLEARLAITRREAEDEFDAWDATLSHDASATTNTADFQHGEEPVPFSQVLQSTYDAKEKKAKKSAEEKRREWEMRVRKEDGVEGPVDWGVGGRDGCGK